MRICAAALIAALAISSAQAGEAEIAAARSSVEAQLKAFLAGDDGLAYSFAAPNIKRMFPTQDAFMSMVRNGYPMVHSPRNYAFAAAEEPATGTVIQRVLLLGPDGKSYEAVYRLERQPDGMFRITSVSVNQSTALSI